MGGIRISPQIIAYMRERPNRTIQLESLARALRLQERQTQQAIARMIRSEEFDDGNLQVVKRGNSWRWVPSLTEEHNPEELDRRNAESGNAVHAKIADEMDRRHKKLANAAAASMNSKYKSPYQISGDMDERFMTIQHLGTFTDGSLLIRGVSGPFGDRTWIAREI